MEFNETLKKFINYIRNKTITMGWKHKHETNNQLYIIIGKYQADDFLEIINNIDDGGYELEWFGSSFYFEINDFLENECGISAENFAFIMEDYIEG